MADLKERYLGDGVYADVDEANQIVLRTSRHNWYDYPNQHWIALEPEVMVELMRFVFDIGWGDLILRIARTGVTDDEYAVAEEDAQRKRDAEEGFE